MRNEKPILIIDDDLVDAMTIKRAFKDIGVSNRIDLVGNGEEALKFLRSDDNEKPALIFLDLNMPKMNGIEYLKIAKSNPDYQRIPVVVLTTSCDQQDKLQSYELGIAGYMLKTVDFNEFKKTIQIIDDYWSICELPEKD